MNKKITGLNKALRLAQSMNNIFEIYPELMHENCDSEVY